MEKKMFKKLSWLLVILLALGLTVGCSDDDDDDDDTTGPSTTDYFEAMVTDGSAYYGGGTKNITGDALYGEIVAGDEIFIIDYRSGTHFADAGHIDLSAIETSNATLVNWAIADLMDNLAQIPANTKIVNVCYSGQTASQATAALRMLGYDAWNLKWGMCGWTSNTDVNLGKWANLESRSWTLELTPNALTDEFDLPEVDLEVETVAEAFTAQIDAYFDAGTKNMDRDVLFENLADGDDSNDPFIVNYWPESFYNFGHITGAVNFDSGIEAFKSLNADALKYLPMDRPVVIYCWTGQTSSQIVVYLNALGYDAYSFLYGINGIQSHDENGDLYKPGTYYYAPENDYPTTTGS
jgi:rhodanese-related sulfurtransferase